MINLPFIKTRVPASSRQEIGSVPLQRKEHKSVLLLATGDILATGSKPPSSSCNTKHSLYVSI